VIVKKAWKIARRVLVSLGLTIYIIVALANYSVVQSVAGIVAGEYFSSEWGGKVHIGALHAMPFDHLIVDDILWVSPTNDTLLVADRLTASFDRFPYRGDGLELNRVSLHNAYYHFATENHKTNLQFLIDYYKKPRKKKKHKVFTVTANELVLDNVHYKMDLPDHRRRVYPYGVQIPHMEFYNINARIKNIKVMNDDVTCRIVRMSTRERSGFEVKRLSGNIHVSRNEIVARNLKVETGGSRINADARLSYNGWKGMKGYVSTVRHEAELKPGTRVKMSDVAYWAPVLWGIDAEAEAVGVATGTIDSMVTNMEVRWGFASSATVAGTITGLPKIDTTVFDVSVDHLLTNRMDMEPLLALGKLNKSVLKLLDNAGMVEVNAQVKGGLNERALVKMTVDSRLGSLRADATVEHDAAGYRMALDAGSHGMNLSMLRSDWLTATAFDLKVNGRWRGNLKDTRRWDERLNAEIEGRFVNSVVKGQRLSPMTVNGELRDGHLTAQAVSTDSAANLTLTVDANLRDSVKSYYADAQVEHLGLGLLPHPLTTHLTALLQGNSLDEMSGEMRARSTHYGPIAMEELVLNVESDAQGKMIELTSDVADATVSGHFTYSELPEMVRHFCGRYLPELFNRKGVADLAQVPMETVPLSIKDNTMRFRVKWKDDGELLREWTESVAIARGTVVDGSYNYGEQLKMVVRSDSVKLGAVRLDNVGLVGHPLGKKYVLQLEAQSLNIGKIELMERVSATIGSTRELGTMELKWGSASGPTRGDLMLGLEGDRLTVIRPWFYVGDSRWELSAGRTQIGNDGRLSLEAEGLSLASEQQRINGHLSLRGMTNDCVELNFDHFNLDLLSEVLLQESPITVSGAINGRFSLYGLTGTPYFNTNLTVDSCVVNNHSLGRVRLNSQWNAEMNTLNLQLINRKIRARGWMGLSKKETDLDFSVDFNGLELALAEPLLASFSSRFDGLLHGNFDIGGTLKKPLIVGEAEVEDGALKIDITDVTYHFADTISFKNNVITLDNFEIRDPLGNIALADGTITLTDEKKLEVDLGLTTDKLLVLNRKDGEQFYGRLLASAQGRVTGPTDHLDIAVSARTLPGCELTIPVNQQQRVKTQNYITFVSEKNIEDEHTEERRKKTNYDLALDLNITPDAKINLPMDFQEVDVNVSATGAGNLHMNLSGTNTAQMIGNYEISSGTMKVGLLSVYEKKFTIENGSSMNFQGNVPDARFDMRAVYSQRVNMSTLTGSLSTVDNTQKYLQVENVIAIAGTLRDPKISFDIRLPNADQSVEDEVFAYIDRNSERDMMNQTLSLLISGSFYNVNSNSQAGSNPLDIVTSFVGNSLTDMVQFVDVDIDFRSATELTNEQLDVNISKDWGRWYLESTLGYGGESRDLDASTVNGAIIDALIGYRLTPMFHLYAYNRTNTNDYTRIDMPYKQGAGLKVTKDFDSWGELFGIKKKSVKKKEKGESKK